MENLDTEARQVQFHLAISQNVRYRHTMNDFRNYLIDRVLLRFSQFLLGAGWERYVTSVGQPESDQQIETSHHGSGSSSKQTAAGRHSSSQSRGSKRSRTSIDNDDDEFEEDDPRNQKMLKAHGQHLEKKKLACPYFKQNPYRFGRHDACSGPGWDSIHRLK